VTTIAHALCLIGNKKFGKDYDEKKVVLTAQYHETGEVITGDLPTPIKYFNPEIKTAYKGLEELACERLLKTLPEEIESDLANYVIPDVETPEYKLVKVADRIAAYLKCVDELKVGNKEFKKAGQSILKELKANPLEEVRFFMENAIPAFELTLDELD
ncbi:MAG: 5'-deoxynucleotidase, partial [Clostridia bacterium]|nr:5'-deoxynucleotidase [Clostridia bacterium]